MVKDGKQFQAHRNVLSLASPFFEKLLSSDMKESNEGVIRLHTITESQMAGILQFIYDGSVQITSENAEKLIETADFLLLSDLKTMVGKFLEQHMTTETCISMNCLAERYSCEELFASTWKFINSNFATVTSSEEFLNLPSHEVEKWISSDEIVIDAEENVFEIILRWIDHNKDERCGTFSELFSLVRLTCVSRDYLLNHVVTNDLVKKNADCLDSVRDALEWLDRPTDCDVPRPHPPRKALMVDVIVIVDLVKIRQPCIYLPAKDKWYLLPPAECQPVSVDEGRNSTVSCGGKVFIITFDIAGSQCYDPDSNRWSSAPWRNELRFYRGTSLVVGNRICLLLEEETDSITLWTFSVDFDSLTPLRNWVEITRFCAVAVDRYIYVIGGKKYRAALAECARFDTEQNEWKKLAPLNEARANAVGVCKNEKIFIAGGMVPPREVLQTCEVYNISTDEWQFIASVTLRRTLKNMVLADETLYLVGGFTRTTDFNRVKSSDKIEHYNQDCDEWNVKASVPVDKITTKEMKARPYYFQACSLRVFKEVLTNLESIAGSD